MVYEEPSPIVSSEHRYTSGEPTQRHRFTEAAFVGREAEMAVLLAGLEAASAGHGRLILLTGEAGIGKTRTALEFAALARSRGIRVLIGRSMEEAGAPPFWPWVQIVRTYLAIGEVDRIQTEMGREAAGIAPVIPDVHAYFPGLPTPPALAAEHARFHFFDSVTTFLKHAAAVSPLVLILDDLHRADEPSLVLLQFLAPELATACLLVIGTYRDGELSSDHPLRHTLGKVVSQPGSDSLPLHGLSATAVAQCIESTLGGPPTAAVAAAVYQRTEGNPFFLTEVMRLLGTEAAHAALHSAQAALALPVPQRVHDVIMQRLQTLSADCQHLLTMAAVIGREFRLPVLEAVKAAGCPGLHCPVLDLLDEALTARLITDVPHSLGLYSFSHALIRQTLYEGLPVSARVRLHRHVGNALEHLCSPYLEPYLAELAAHFCVAAQDGETADKAITYAVQAGDHATALLAYEEAANHYTQALQLLEFHTPNGALQCDVLLALGEVQRKAGTMTAARDTLQRAASLARTLNMPERFAHAALGFATGYAGISMQDGMADPLVIGLLQEALTVLPPADSALRARVLGRLAAELYWSATREQRVTISQQAVDMARRLGDPVTLAYTLHATLVALRDPEHPEDRLATATEIIQLAEAIGDAELVLRGYIGRVVALLELGDITAVEHDMAAYARYAEALRQPFYLWVLTMWKSMRAELHGDFADAERLAHQALAMGQRVQDAEARQYFLVQTGPIRSGRKSQHDVELPIRDLVAQYASISRWRPALALLYSTMQREADARREFEYLAVNDFDTVPRQINWLNAIANLAQVCVWLQDTARAARLYQILLPFAEQCVVVGPGVACLGSVARFLGQLATTLSRWEEAEAHFTMALQRNAHLGARPALAQTQRHYAAMLLLRQEPGDREQAITLLHQALTVGQELAMDDHVQQTRALLETAQPQRTSARRTDSQAPHLAETTNRFCQEGDYWTISYHGTVFRLNNIRGLHYIAHLLQHPHQEFHVFDLVALGRKPASRQSVSRPLPGDLGNAGDLLDAQARNAYKQRLQELRQDLAEAQRCNDEGRGETVQREIDALLGQLAAAVGMGGHSRQAASHAERARVNVTHGIRTALTRIAAHSPSLAHELTTTLKTGLFCVYTPAPHRSIVWQF